MIRTAAAPRESDSIQALRVLVFPHPQGCRSFLVVDPESGQAMAIDVHLDSVGALADEVRSQGWSLPFIVDTHTHADHPSGAGELARLFGSTRVAHEKAGHAGVTRYPQDGDSLPLGNEQVTLYHCPGHTPDHIVLTAGGALFSGDTLLIGGVARTDFLDGNAGALFDSIHRLLALFPDETVLYPSHDYNGRIKSSLVEERRTNPWLAIENREEFVRSLTANPPPRPANMDALLRMNREGVEVPSEITPAEAIERIRQGGAVSVLDVRTDVEFEAEHIEGSIQVPLDQLEQRSDEVRAIPAPRLLLCRSGSRAEKARQALSGLGLSGLSVVQGGLEAYRGAGGETESAGQHVSLERQVRIAAGTLVLVGVALGSTLHPLFLVISGFVGAGLVFAGVTDWCGMGLLLARMPWNRRSTERSAATTGTCAASAPGTCAASTPAACAASAPGTDAASPATREPAR